ncbi:MAG: YebC/PmpR family DNA-binding transcriptional regulator [Clostridiaceae bacterium]|nr:YebC/PmpR family DNA-binding transcriptional regulator [Clostridiaceae bacterium]
MAGHSKWNNIKRRKETADAQRGKIFTKLGREIAVAVREGGADPESNAQLKDIINRAKRSNMPNDSIQRSIDRASGVGSENSFEHIIYEGYGPSGVAFIVKCLTDNRNRTAGEVRHYFDRYGGNLGTSGCVSFMFTEKGQLLIDREAADEDELLEAALEAGAEDVEIDEQGYTVITDPTEYFQVERELAKQGYEFLESGVVPIPGTTVTIEDQETADALVKLIEALEDSDDVQEVFHNWDMPDEE